jgi:DNA-damage-inducible protein D
MGNLKLFESTEIRTVWNTTDQKWYFVLVDVVQVLTETPNPSDYIKKIRKRDPALTEGWGQLVTPLLVITAGGKQRMNCANAQGLLRIIQSIPSPKAEPFKIWLAKVGAERLDEIENPELAAHRTRELYRLKGYSDDWIEKRLRSIAIREELTDEWKKRGVREKIEYTILTAEISKATFGLTPSEYKALKGLKNHNLRDHMTDLELIFSMLGEASTKEIVLNTNPKGFIQNKKVAHSGGKIAGDARKQLELKSGKSVVTSDNYLEVSQKLKASEERKQLEE